MVQFLPFLAKRGAPSDEPGVSLPGVSALEEETNTHSRQTQLLPQPVEYHEELYWQRAVQDSNACEYQAQSSTPGLTHRKSVTNV